MALIPHTVPLVLIKREVSDFTNDDHEPLSNRTKMIIGVASGIALLIVVTIVIYCCVRNRRRKRKNYSSRPSHSTHQNHEMEWKLHEHLHQNQSKPSGSKPSKPPTGGSGYQHDPEASEGLLSHASAPGTSSNTDSGGHEHGHSASIPSVNYPSGGNTTTTNNNSNSASAPLLGGGAPYKPPPSDYDGSQYGRPPPPQPLHPGHAPFNSPPPPQNQIPPFQGPPLGPGAAPPPGPGSLGGLPPQRPQGPGGPPLQRPQGPGGPPPQRPQGPGGPGGPGSQGQVPLYLQQTSGGEADDYFANRSRGQGGGGS